MIELSPNVKNHEKMVFFYLVFSFFFLQIEVSSPLNIKKEKVSIASDVIIGSSKPARANRKKVNAIQCDGTQNQTASNQDQAVQVKAEAMITAMDTIDSLREKFPKATAFEFEFLMFLKGSQQ